MATGSEEILEGFICPICKKDLVTAILLSTHFQEEHNEDQDVLRSLKDLFGKAKKKILKQDSPEHESGSSPSQTPNQYRTRSSALYSSYQTVGVSRSHMGYFHHIRNSRVERYAAETNKLLIRLDKLLIEMPSDPVKRKAHEQQVVPWVEDADVRLCPNCARPFHILTRRKHHCRLCGAIMCHECSEFITLAIARKLTNPAFGLHRPPLASDVSKDSVQQQLSSPSSSPALNSSALRRSASNSSLGSALSAPLPGLGPSSEPSRLRLCPHCRKKRMVHQWKAITHEGEAVRCHKALKTACIILQPAVSKYTPCSKLHIFHFSPILSPKGPPLQSGIPQRQSKILSLSRPLSSCS